MNDNILANSKQQERYKQGIVPIEDIEKNAPAYRIQTSTGNEHIGVGRHTSDGNDERTTDRKLTTCETGSGKRSDGQGWI
jgi:hypothetical protein